MHPVRLGRLAPWASFPEVPRKVFLSASTTTMPGVHQVSELLGNHWKCPKHKSKPGFSQAPMDLAPGRKQKGSLGSVSGPGTCQGQGR